MAGVHRLTELCLEFLSWEARFGDSTDVAPAGASSAEILETLTEEERGTTAVIAASKGEQWVVDNWGFLRIQVLYIRSL
jgi:hypothetical protein